MGAMVGLWETFAVAGENVLRALPLKTGQQCKKTMGCRWMQLRDCGRPLSWCEKNLSWASPEDQIYGVLVCVFKGRG